MKNTFSIAPLDMAATLAVAIPLNANEIMQSEMVAELLAAYAVETADLDTVLNCLSGLKSGGMRSAFFDCINHSHAISFTEKPHRMSSASQHHYAEKMQIKLSQKYWSLLFKGLHLADVVSENLLISLNAQYRNENAQELTDFNQDNIAALVNTLKHYWCEGLAQSVAAHSQQFEIKEGKQGRLEISMQHGINGSFQHQNKTVYKHKLLTDWMFQCVALLHPSDYLHRLCEQGTESAESGEVSLVIGKKGYTLKLSGKAAEQFKAWSHIST